MADPTTPTKQQTEELLHDATTVDTALPEPDRILSQETLAATQHEAQGLYEKFKAANDKAGKSDDPADKAAVDAILAQYDVVDAKLQSHARAKAQEERRKAIAERMHERHVGSRLSSDVQNRLRGAAADALIDAGGDPDQLEHVIPKGRVSSALRAAILGAKGRMSSISRGDMEAAAEFGLVPGSKDIEFNLYNQGDYDELSAAFMAEIDNAGRNQKARLNAARRARNSLHTGTGGAGGNYLFGTTFVTTLEEAMLAYGDFLNYVDVMRTSTGEPMYMPTTNDTANNGRMIGETLTSPPIAVGDKVNYVDPAFARGFLTAHTGTSEAILISHEVLTDNSVGLETKLAQMLGMRLARLKNRICTNGAGTTEAVGIVPASVVGETAASNAAIVLDELLDLIESIEWGRRQTNACHFMMNSGTLNLLQKLKDGDGNYIWKVDARSGTPDTLHAYPYIINQDMPSVGASARSVLFGDMQSYKMREVTQRSGGQAAVVIQLSELYRESNQIAFLAFNRFDGILLNAGDNPVKCLVHPA